MSKGQKGAVMTKSESAQVNYNKLSLGDGYEEIKIHNQVLERKK